MLQSLRDWLKPGGVWHRQRVVEMTLAGGCAIVAVALLAAVFVKVGSSARGDREARKAPKGDVRVRVQPDASMRNGDYALFATLVKGDSRVLWTRRVPNDGALQVGDVGAGRHVLSLTMSRCTGRDCETFHGGASLGVVQLQGHDRARIAVVPRCRATGSASAGAAAVPLDCSASVIRDSRDGG